MQDDPTTPLNHEDPGSPEMPPVSEVWGDFRLRARVGHGSFGEGYRAFDPDLEREVALKLPRPDRGITPEINAISTLIFALSVALIVIWYRIRTRSLGAKPQDLLEQAAAQQQEQAA